MVLKSLIGKIVSNVSIIMWPPWGETNHKDIILSCRLALNDGRFILLDTDGNQYSILAMEVSDFKSQYVITDLSHRIEYWSNFSDTQVPVLESESFLVDNKSNLYNLIGREIKNVILLNKGDTEINPYGLKLIFENNTFLYSFSNTYGNSIQTEGFMNYIDPLIINNFLGVTIEISINDVKFNSW